MARICDCPARKILTMLLVFSVSSTAYSSTKPETLNGVYVPPGCQHGRIFEGLVHYMQAAGLNLAVLHAKDPFGRLSWKSNNSIAKNMNASFPHASLENCISILKQKGIWTAAKLDVFQDSHLVTNYPEWGVRNIETGELWTDHKGIHWANPFDIRVWDYTIALCMELIALGVDEIQFDYVRFPSDGDMATIEYPIVMDDTAKEECIGKFLAYASSKLKPTGVLISVDLFGMVAWKTEDFGVGQVLEEIAPHVDVVFPIFYPSHFPENFLRLENPGRYPYKIMKSSLVEIKKRTGKEIRPWIQGFWYTPDEIDAQLRGIRECDIHNWTVWNPSGKYAKTFDALAASQGVTFPEPEFYPPLEDLRDREDLLVPGQTKIINKTNYREGYSILSLDDPAPDENKEFTTISGIIATLDESIVDLILSARAQHYTLWTSRRTKTRLITNLIIQDLDIDPRRMNPFPIYIEWDGVCVFTKSIPQDRLELYLSENEQL